MRQTYYCYETIYLILFLETCIIWNHKVTFERYENTNAISWWLEHHCGRGTDIYKCSFKVANYLWLVTLEIVTNGIQVLKLHSFINLGTINKIRRQFFQIFDLLSSFDFLTNFINFLSLPTLDYRRNLWTDPIEDV